MNRNSLGIFLKSQVAGIHLRARLVLVECLLGLNAFVGSSVWDPRRNLVQEGNGDG
jgi:hypothetical protein